MRPDIIIELAKEMPGIPVTLLCKWFNIPRSTYYRWTKKVKAPADAALVERIRELCVKHKFRYGYRKITAILRKDQHINHKRVQRIMQEKRLQCRVRVKKRKQTGQPLYVAPNVLQRQFYATKPMQKLVTDITYLPFGGKMLYLSSILDLYNSEIVAYSLSEKQDTELVLHTLNQLPKRKGMMLHSDQGSVYTSERYQAAVKGKGITMSMSRKGTPADNAPIESFHSTLKTETFYLDDLCCTTTPLVEQLVREYIVYYNTSRMMTKLNNQSPRDFRRLAA